MPTVLQVGSYRFSFYAADCAEKPHVHVFSQQKAAKFWLDPVELFSSNGFRQRELRQLQRITEANQALLLNAWDAFCNQ